MKNILLMIIATIPLQIIAQPKKRVSVRDFNSFSDYGLFSKYRDSLNTLNKVKLDYEYLDEFKKIIASRDSLTAIEDSKIIEAKKLIIKNDSIAKENTRREYIEKTKFNDYIGAYELTPFKHKSSKTFTGIMIIDNESVFFSPYPNESGRLLLVLDYKNQSLDNLTPGTFSLNSKYTNINMLAFDHENGLIFFSEYFSQSRKSMYIFKFKKIKEK